MSKQSQSGYIPTDEQGKYINQDTGKIVLNACPGSGKTVTVAYKLTKLITKHEQCADLGGVACLSFTNVAKDEIQDKYLQITGKLISAPHIVSTIDHFINNYITLPFCHKILGITKRPKIIESVEFLDKMNYGDFKNKKGKLLKYSYKPSEIEFEVDGGYSWKGKKPDKNSVDIAIFNDYAKAVKGWQLRNGLLKTSDSAYVALDILKSIPNISKYLSQRFTHIIIDEAQDTSEIQYAIIDKLIEGGLANVEYVGDPYQALYEWRDAKPEIFYDKYSKGVFLPFTLKKCKRSSQNIIDVYSKLRKASDEKIESDVVTEELAVIIYKYAAGDESKVVDLWKGKISGKYESNNVLVRGNALKNQLLGVFSSKIEPWESDVPYLLFQAVCELNRKEIKKAVSTFRKAIPYIEGIKEYYDIKERERELFDEHATNGLIFEVLKSCPDLGLGLEDWTKQAENLLSDNFKGYSICFNLKSGNLPSDLKSDTNKTWKNLYLKAVRDLFGVSGNQLGVSVSTIHGEKGRTFDSVLLFLAKRGLSLDDVCEIVEMPSENQRMIYVAMSRPRHLLAIAVPNDYSDEVIKSKLGDKVEIVNV